MKKVISVILSVLMLATLCACAKNNAKPNTNNTTEAKTRIITDANGRKVEVPAKVNKIVCVGVGALRYTCYMEAADLVVGVEDYETKAGMSRLYNYVNFDKFKDLPVIGTNGDPNTEAIVNVAPDVIVMSKSATVDPDEVQTKCGTPVVMVPGSDTTLDDNAYETIKIMGELYNKTNRAEDLTKYLKGVQKDLAERTAKIADKDKPSVYVGGVAFKGVHGFEGTEAYYGPFELIGAKNLANTTGQKGAFDIDTEQVLKWDPDYIFLDFYGMDLINEDYAKNPKFYNSLSAVKNGKVYSQIPFRSSASNLETALADSYYAATIIYPEQFKDINPEEKAGEIFEKLLNTNPYDDLKGAGYEFRQITLGK